MFKGETRRVNIIFNTDIVADLNDASVVLLTARCYHLARYLLHYNKGSLVGFDGAITVDPTDTNKCTFEITNSQSLNKLRSGKLGVEVTLQISTTVRTFRIDFETVGKASVSTVASSGDITVNVEPVAAIILIGDPNPIEEFNETDPTVPSHVKAISTTDITNWNNNNIGSEATTRAAADVVLQTNITTEATARAAADATLQTNITAEATARGIAIAAAIEGLKQKEACRVMAITNIVTSGAQTIDGVVLAATNRVFLQNQSDPSENGIWVVSNSAWARSADANIASELINALIPITEGTYAKTTWRITNSSIILGSTAITSEQFGASTPDATDSVKGKMKLYAGTGTNTDGTINQDALTTLLNELDTAITEEEDVRQYSIEQAVAAANIYYLRIDVDASSMANAFTTPFEIIPSPGANFAIDVISARIMNGGAWSFDEIYLTTNPGAGNQFQVVDILSTPTIFKKMNQVDSPNNLKADQPLCVATDADQVGLGPSESVTFFITYSILSIA